MGGIESSERIRAEVKISQQPVIIGVSADASNDNEQKSLQAGMNYFISKPINLPLLKKILYTSWASVQEQQQQQDRRKSSSESTSSSDNNNDLTATTIPANKWQIFFHSFPILLQ